MDWMVGEVNSPINISTGLVNILVLWLVIFFGVKSVSLYRKVNFFKQIMTINHCNIKKVGVGIPIRVEREDIHKVKKFFSSMFTLWFLFSFLVVFPFLFQERLFMFFTFLLVVIVVFSGGYYDNQIAVYKMKTDEDKGRKDK